MRLTIKIEGSELSDVLLELDEVVSLVRKGVMQNSINNKHGLSEHHFKLELEPATRARKHVEKKSSRKGKRNA